jgi:MORN repeat variant
MNRPLEPLPATPASDADHAPALSRALSRERLLIHAVRALAVASAVATVGAGVSIYFSVVGLRECEEREGATHCREVHTYPFSVQVHTELHTRNGVAHGARNEWHINGSPWFAGSYQDGMRVGTWTEWHPNGVPRFTGHYVADRLSGFETWWYASGQKEWQVQRDDGRRVGPEQWWHENGQLRRVGAYNLRGEKDGPFTVFDEDGNARFSGSYENGVLRGDGEGGGDGEAE